MTNRNPGPPRSTSKSYTVECEERVSRAGIDRLIEAMAEVIDYPDDPLRTFPTSDPYVKRVEFGEAGLITYLINDGASMVIIPDITWTG